MLSDLAITQACARALGYREYVNPDKRAPLPVAPCILVLKMDENATRELYDPLTDDAQCMALVKRFGIGFDPTRGEDFASAAIRDEHGTMLIFCDPSLNRAICLCVAHMQLTKEAKHAE